MRATFQIMNRSLFHNFFYSIPIYAGIFILSFGCSGKAVTTPPPGYNQLQSDNKKMNREISILHARIDDILKSQPGLSDEEIELFRKKGLSNPEEDIVNDLGSREDLMPFTGIFGARPSFYKDVRMYVLNSKWVYTFWDSGGAVGQQLFEYAVSDSGKITWKLIAKLKK